MLNRITGILWAQTKTWREGWPAAQAIIRTNASAMGLG